MKRFAGTRKVLVALLAFILTATSIPLSAFAAGSNEDNTLEDGWNTEETFDKAHCHGACFDTLFVNGQFADCMNGQGGGADAKLDAVGRIISGENGRISSLTYRGWIGFEEKLEGIGYQIDNGEPVFGSFAVATEDAVRFDANGGSKASRYAVTVYVNGLKGRHKIALMAKVNGVIVRLDDTVKSITGNDADTEIIFRGPGSLTEEYYILEAEREAAEKKAAKEAEEKKAQEAGGKTDETNGEGPVTEVTEEADDNDPSEKLPEHEEIDGESEEDDTLYDEPEVGTENESNAHYHGSSLDTLFLNGVFAPVMKGQAGGATAKLDATGRIVEAGDGRTKEVRFQGWIGFEEPIEALGYQIDDEEPVFGSFAIATEAVVKEPQHGGALATRYIINVDTNGLNGRHKIAVAVKVAGETVRIDSDLAPAGMSNADTEIIFRGPGSLTEEYYRQQEEKPVIIDPSGDKLIIDDPDEDKPAAEEPVTDDPVDDEPGIEEPVEEEPAEEEPVEKEPIEEEPVEKEPIEEEPSGEDPVIEDPVIEEPAPEDPEQDEPAAEDPVSGEPAADDPAEGKPAEDKPAQEPEKVISAHYHGSSFDTLFLNGAFAPVMGGQAGGATDKLDASDRIVEAGDGRTKEVRFQGWIGFEEPIEAFGYQIDDEDPVYGSYAIPTEAVVKEDQHGGALASRYAVNVNVNGLSGRHKIALVVRVNREAVRVDSELAPDGMSNADTEIIFRGPGSLTEEYYKQLEEKAAEAETDTPSIEDPEVDPIETDPVDTDPANTDPAEDPEIVEPVVEDPSKEDPAEEKPSDKPAETIAHFHNASFDSLFINGKLAPVMKGVGGGASDKLDSIGRIVDCTDGSTQVLAFRGWAGFEEDIEAFGYQIDDNDPIFGSFAIATEDAVRLEANGGPKASRFEVKLDVSGLQGRHEIAVVVKVNGAAVRLDEAVSDHPIHTCNTAIIFRGPGSIEEGEPTEDDGDTKYYIDAIKLDGALVTAVNCADYLKDNKITAYAGRNKQLGLYGWAFLSTGISGFAYVIDDGANMTGSFGADRPDVKKALGAGAEGFSVSIDISGLAVGEHTVTLNALDPSGIPVKVVSAILKVEEDPFGADLYEEEVAGVEYDPQTAPDEDATVELWFDHISEKVNKDVTTPSGLYTYVMHMAGNSIEDCQFFLAPEATRTFTIAAAPFTDEDGHTLRTELFYEEYVNVKGSLVPDAIPPLRGAITVGGGTSQGFVIKAWAESGCTPGLYTSTIDVKDNATGKIIKTAKVYTVVRDFSLSDETALSTAFGMDKNKVLSSYHGNYYGQSDIYKNYYDFMLENRICLYSLPYSLTDSRVTQYLNNPRVTDFCVNRTYDCSASTANRVLSNKEWRRKAYFYYVDEPQESVKLNDLRSKGNMLRSQFGSDYRMVSPFFTDNAIAGTDQINYMKDALSIWCTKPYAFTPADGTLPEGTRTVQSAAQDAQYGTFTERMDAEIAGGDEVWTYVCWEPEKPYCNWMLTDDGTECIVSVWQLRNTHSTGLLYWDTTYWTDGLKTTPISDPVWGDGVLIHSGARYGLGTPVSSLRLENLREGIQDYQMLHMVEQAEGAASADSLAQMVSKSVVEFTNNDAYLHACRVKLCDTVEGLMQ